MNEKSKIIVVDDHELFRDGLKFFLSQYDDFEVIAEAADGKEFLTLLEYMIPDLVLMDISMPELDGIEATMQALKINNCIKIIALSSFGDEIYYYKMIQAGASGFLIKDADKNEIEKAIRIVLQGKSYFSKELLQNIVISKYGTDNHFKFSKRELEILQLVCQGYSNNEIAEQLNLSPKTVENHRTNLLSKTSAKNSANLVMYAIKNKLIEL